MFKHLNQYLLGFVSGIICLLSANAQEGQPAPAVCAAAVEQAQATDTRQYTGTLLSPSRVELVARVSGELLEVGFTEGAVVKAGQVMYRLDDVRYDAQVKSAEAAIARCEASLQYSEANFKRVDALYKKNVSTLDAMESAKMNYQTDQANLLAAKAALITAQDDLKNTRITAPISGKVGLTNFTYGDYLTPAAGTLATIVQLDPIRLSFSISTRDYLLFFGNEKNFTQEAKVKIVLADGSVYPQSGTFEFRNNEVNRSTDTIQFFVSFPNPDAELLPNSSVTVLLEKQSAEALPAVLSTAVMSDAQSSYVYVLDEKDIPSRRDVVLGSMSGDALQQIRSGLKVGERVVSDGTHKVIPGQPVRIVPPSNAQ